MSRKRQLLPRKILEVLVQAKGYPLPETSLREFVDGLLPPPCSADEWSAAIRQLTDRQAIDAAEDSFAAPDDEKQWVITAAGRALLNTL